MAFAKTLITLMRVFLWSSVFYAIWLRQQFGFF